MDYATGRTHVLDLLPKGDVGAEIGVWQGGFTDRILAHARPRRLYAVDPWVLSADPVHRDAWYGAASGVDMDAVYAGFLRDFDADIASGVLQVRREKSAAALSRIEPGSLGFVYIDGDHTYDAVRRDLDLSLAVCRKGGLICLDDHCPGKWWGDSVLRAAAAFLQAHEDRCTVRFSGGAQLVIEVMEGEVTEADVTKGHDGVEFR